MLDKTCKLDKPRLTKRSYKNNSWISPIVINSINENTSLSLIGTQQYLDISRKLTHGKEFLNEKISKILLQAS